MKLPKISRKKRTGATEPLQYITPIEDESQILLNSVSHVRVEMEDYYRRLLAEDLTQEAEQKAESYKRAAFNLTKAARQVYSIKDELSGRIVDVKQQRNKNILFSAPSNAAIDLKEQEAGHFAAGMNGYKLFLICFLGSFFGVVIEMIWCLLKNGYIESRAGLVYGPFNLLYGAGAVLLTVCLYKFRNMGAWISFLGGILVGSVLEYVCSWGQEFVLGTRSWDYSNMPFNINGRICLLYSVFWGFLSVLWIKNLYPRIAKWILKLPNRAGKVITWVLVVFLVVNSAVSFLALFRWSQRTEGIEASNVVWQVIDDRFPDERMERIYANMELSE